MLMEMDPETFTDNIAAITLPPLAGPVQPTVTSGYVPDRRAAILDEPVRDLGFCVLRRHDLWRARPSPDKGRGVGRSYTFRCNLAEHRFGTAANDMRAISFLCPFH
jgi:hypothetical protein